MYTANSLALAALVAFGAASPQLVGRADPKANEYTSGDCSGGINYGHHNTNLVDVTMDDSSNSVYLAGGTWLGFTDKTSNGGSCYGTIVSVVGGCNNLNQRDANLPNANLRIKCVRNS